MLATTSGAKEGPLVSNSRSAGPHVPPCTPPPLVLAKSKARKGPRRHGPWHVMMQALATSSQASQGYFVWEGQGRPEW